ncbi:MAG: hypothetical protein K0R73_296 [Candidatus Midichloriaceae bacterium]|jgi:hypothetical protein|nr:hypothetical protein [Candidatus Midichloriaceae bacterium]
MELPGLKGSTSLPGPFECIIPKDMLNDYFAALKLEYSFDSIPNTIPER